MLDQRRRRWADVVEMLYNVLCLLECNSLSAFTKKGCFAIFASQSMFIDNSLKHLI